MRCRDAKLWLNAQRESDLAQNNVLMLEQHLKQCPACRAYQKYQQHVDRALSSPTPQMRSGISTERIMLAVQQQRRITQQLEHIRSQQQFRMTRLKNVGPSLAVITFFTLSILPVLLFVLTLVQPNLITQFLVLLSSAVDPLLVLAQYLQTGLTLITRDNWLLSGVAFVLVLMTGMWFRLMRYPQEA